MNSYDKFFTNMASAMSAGDVDPTVAGGVPQEVDSVVSTVEDSLRVGTLAGQISARVLDGKVHFPVTTETQARSSMARAMQLGESPAWYNGTVSELRLEIYNSIISAHSEITDFNVNVPAEQAVGLSDGQEPSTTTIQSVKDPVTESKNTDEVPQVKRPTLTSAFKGDSNHQKIIAGRLVELLQKQSEHLKLAQKLASRLIKSGLTGEEFDTLSTFIQEDMLRELMHKGTTASDDGRRQELLARMAKKDE